MARFAILAVFLLFADASAHADSLARWEIVLTPPREPLTDDSTGARIGELADFPATGPATRLLLRQHRSFPWHVSAVVELDARIDGAIGTAPVPVPPPAARAAGVGSLSLHEAYVTWSYEEWRLRAGRQRIEWGPALRGSLMFAPTAPPLDAISFGTTRPWKGLSMDVIAIRLEDDRGHPWISAQRLAYGYRFLTFGAQRTILCCEAGAGVRLADVPEIFAGTRENDDGHRLNFDQIASVSASVDLRGIEAWIEHGGTGFYGIEDVAAYGGLPAFTTAATIAGASLRAGPLALRGEWADVEDPIVSFYGHHRYPEGHTFLRSPLGHPAGGRSRSILVEARVGDFGVYALEERMNLHTDTRARRSRGGVTAGWYDVGPHQIAVLARVGLLEEWRAGRGVSHHPEAHVSVELARR